MKISASAVKKYKACHRRWAFGKLAGLQEPGSKYTQEGRDCHAIAERWLSLGVLRGDPKQVAAFSESIPILPRPGTCGVEIPFEYVVDGVIFHGFIDAWDFTTGQKIDHKFVGSFGYAMTPADLAVDPQAIIYAMAPPTVPVPELVWSYVAKRGGGSRPTVLRLPLVEAEAVLRSSILPAAREMCEFHDAFAGQSAETKVDLINELVPCNPGDCLSFGIHCPHGRECSHTEPYHPTKEPKCHQSKN